MKSCLPKTWYYKLIEKHFGIVFTCDYRCHYKKEHCMYDENGKKQK